MATPPLPASASSGGIAGELADSLKAFFDAHSVPISLSKDRFDIDRFVKVQGFLAVALGEVPAPATAAAAFMEVSAVDRLKGGTAALGAFAKWQVASLAGKGVCRGQMADVIGRAIAALGDAGAQDISQHERLRLARRAGEKARLDREAERRGNELRAQFMRDREQEELGRRGQKIRKADEKVTALTALEERLGKEEDKRGENRLAKEAKAKRKEEEEQQAAEALKKHAAEQQTLFAAQRQAPVLGRTQMALHEKLEPSKGSVLQSHEQARSKGLVQPKSLYLQSVGLRRCSDSVGLEREAFLRLLAHGRDAPEARAASVSQLASYLIEPAVGDEQKAWVIFSWVCHHVNYDVDGLHGRAPKQSCKSADVLRSRLSVCAGYASIFERLAHEAGLTVRTVCGVARNSSNQVGQEMCRERDGHAWNALSLSGEWILIDCTWGAGHCTDTDFSRRFEPHFFGTPPEQFAFTHYPDDSSWQLLAAPVTKEVFAAQPIVFNSLFRYSLSFAPDLRTPGAVLLRGSNASSVQLKVPSNVSLMIELDGEKNRCFQERRPAIGGNAGMDLVTVHFRAPRLVVKHSLKIYARQCGEGSNGSKETSYDAACEFNVMGPAGPAGWVQPYFPEVHNDVFQEFGLTFLEALPNGALLPDEKGVVQLSLGVPEDIYVMGKLEGVGATIQRSGKRVTFVLQCPSVIPSSGHRLNIFVSRQEYGVSYSCAVSYLVLGSLAKAK